MKGRNCLQSLTIPSIIMLSICMLILFSIAVALLSSSALAIPESFQYENMTVKLYDHGINKSDAIEFLGTISYYHYAGLDYLKIYNWNFCRRYLSNWGRFNYLYNGIKIIYVCGLNKDTLVHELAHKYQYEWGGNLSHSIKFQSLMRQITFEQ